MRVFRGRRQGMRGLSLVDAMVSAALLGVVMTALSSLSVRLSRDKKAIVERASSDTDRYSLLKIMAQHMGNSKVARYYHLPVNNSECSLERPGLYFLKDGKFSCANQKSLGLTTANISFFSDAVSDNQQIGLQKLTRIESGAKPEDIKTQAPRSLTFEERRSIHGARGQGVPLVGWPLVSDQSKPFVLMKQRDLGGTLSFRYVEDAIVQPAVNGPNKDYVILGATSTGLQAGQLIGKLLLLVSEADPQHYFVKAVDGIVNCSRESPDFKTCLKIACHAKPEKDECEQKLGNDLSVVHYAVKLSSVETSVELQTKFLPQGYNGSLVPSYWRDQQPSFYVFPTKIVNIFRWKVGDDEPKPLVEGDVDLKKIASESANIPEIRANWLAIPVDLIRYYLVRDRAKTETGLAQFNLMSDVFSNDITAVQKPVTLMKILEGTRIVFARELTTSNLSIYEQEPKVPARSLAAVSLNDLNFTPRTITVSDVEIEAPQDDLPGKGKAVGQYNGINGSGCLNPLECGNLWVHAKQYNSEYNGVSGMGAAVNPGQVDSGRTPSSQNGNLGNQALPGSAGVMPVGAANGHLTVLPAINENAAGALSR